MLNTYDYATLVVDDARVKVIKERLNKYPNTEYMVSKTGNLTAIDIATKIMPVADLVKSVARD